MCRETSTEGSRVALPPTASWAIDATGERGGSGTTLYGIASQTSQRRTSRRVNRPRAHPSRRSSRIQVLLRRADGPLRRAQPERARVRAAPAVAQCRIRRDRGPSGAADGVAVRSRAAAGGERMRACARPRRCMRSAEEGASWSSFALLSPRLTQLATSLPPSPRRRRIASALFARLTGACRVSVGSRRAPR